MRPLLFMMPQACILTHSKAVTEDEGAAHPEAAVVPLEVEEA